LREREVEHIDLRLDWMRWRAATAQHTRERPMRLVEIRQHRVDPERGAVREPATGTADTADLGVDQQTEAKKELVPIMRIDLMIEGQEGVTWPQWQAIAAACEEHGISTLFRSDHYMNLDGAHPERGALDAMGTCIALAATTTKVRLGTMVSPVTFRHPSEIARLATTTDVISGGRFELGLGAGWHEREHAAHGFEFYNLKTRLEILEEQLQIVLGNWQDGPFSFSGKHYRLEQLDARPKPVQKPHPPLLMGGAAGPKVAGWAGRYADEYNTSLVPLAELKVRKARIDAAVAAAGRAPIPLSVMASVVIGADEAGARRHAEAAAELSGIPAETLLADAPSNWLVGTVDQLAEQLSEYKAAGVSRILAQIPHDDLESVELLGAVLAPRLA
jgi:alkanesulfonate monooxygenase SsuD/methylene tetrahydromethanopterin reductase-like flavin-dependent oxidoreductase (luciferase family)